MQDDNIQHTIEPHADMDQTNADMEQTNADMEQTHADMEKDQVGYHMYVNCSCTETSMTCEHTNTYKL